MSSNDDLELDDLEVDLSFEDDQDLSANSEPLEASSGLNEVDLALEDLSLIEETEEPQNSVVEEQDSSLQDIDLSFSDGEDINLSIDDSELAADISSDEGLDLNLNSTDLDLSSDLHEISLSEEKSENIDESLNLDESLSLSIDLSLEENQGIDFSDDAKEKLKQIDAILTEDASLAHVVPQLNLVTEDEDKSFEVSASDFQLPDEIIEVKTSQETKTKIPEIPIMSQQIEQHEVKSTYSGEMERIQATISNLRADREDLTKKINELEAKVVLESRKNLELRSELDEKKVELTIIRKRMQEEINHLKDRHSVLEDKKQFLEQKILNLESQLEDWQQRGRLDLKKGSTRERELEQKLELLKVDADSQIKHRDLKILELKRKIDHLEFDLDSANRLEKKSMEGKYELQEKLDKTLRTLKNAIEALEEANPRDSVLKVLKKNAEI